MITSACAAALAGLSSTKQPSSGSVNLHGAHFRGGEQIRGYVHRENEHRGAHFRGWCTNSLANLCAGARLRGGGGGNEYAVTPALKQSTISTFEHSLVLSKNRTFSSTNWENEHYFETLSALTLKIRTSLTTPLILSVENWYLRSVSRQECERQQCERHQCEANSANANSAKGSTVRMPTVRMRQRCECQQCECDSSAKDDSPNCAKPFPQLRPTRSRFSTSVFVLLYPSFAHKRSTIGVRNSA